ncbi:MAG: ABC transporter permease [Bdellovibrionia bacterium]
MRPNRLLFGTAAAWVCLFWLGCVAVPLVTLLARVKNWSALWDPLILQITYLTAGQALISAVISAAVALPLGLWIGSSGLAERRWAQALLALPFGVPTVVAGLAWVILLGRSGIFAGLDWAYSFKAVILAHVVFNVPWIALWVAQARSYLPASRLEAARTLGARGGASFRTIIWPQVKWSFWSAACQTFVFCAMSFALILVLGGGPPVQTLEIALFSHIRFGSLDIDGAIACAIWELLVTLLPWCLVVYFQMREEHAISRSTRERGLESSRGFFLRWLPVGVALVFFLPYLAVLTTGRHWGESAYFPIRDEVVPALWISLKLALATAFGALFTSICAVLFIEMLPRQRSNSSSALRGALLFLMGVPNGISALVLGLGLWLAYGKWIDPFSGSYGAIIALQMTIFFPIAFRILWPIARDRDQKLVEAALLMGASRTRAFFTVEWSRWKAPLLSAFAMVVGASLGEVSAVSLFYSEDLIPLPLLVSRWSAQYRFGDAQAVAVLLLFLCSGVILLAYPFAYLGKGADRKISLQ